MSILLMGVYETLEVKYKMEFKDKKNRRIKPTFYLHRTIFYQVLLCGDDVIKNNTLFIIIYKFV